MMGPKLREETAHMLGMRELRIAFREVWSVQMGGGGVAGRHPYWPLPTGGQGRLGASASGGPKPCSWWD